MMLSDGRIEGNNWITKRIHLDKIVEDGFGTLIGPEKKAQVKVIVTPDVDLL